MKTRAGKYLIKNSLDNFQCDGNGTIVGPSQLLPANLRSITAEYDAHLQELHDRYTQNGVYFVDSTGTREYSLLIYPDYPDYIVYSSKMAGGGYVPTGIFVPNRLTGAVDVLFALRDIVSQRVLDSRNFDMANDHHGGRNKKIQKTRRKHYKQKTRRT